MKRVAERVANLEEIIHAATTNLSNTMRVAAPGIIQSFDPVEQTVTVQIAIKEIIQLGEIPEDIALPILVDVPIVLPRAGGYTITFPIQKGDECLVIFGDMCIDGWWSSGGVQNQLEKRRHDLSDGFAILGPWSQPRRISNYSTNSMQLRNESGTQMVEIKQDRINLKGNIHVLGTFTQGG